MGRRKIAVFTGSKGRGSNMAAIIRATHDPDFPAEVAVVVTPKPDTPAQVTAESFGTKVRVINPKDMNYAIQIKDLIEELDIEIVCLAGYTTLFPLEIIRNNQLQIINIHPALLPKFGGKGMYGIHVHKAVLESGDQISGCTVHYVSEEYDEGKILLQKTCPVFQDDSAETLGFRVLEQEHIAYPEAIKILCNKV